MVRIIGDHHSSSLDSERSPMSCPNMVFTGAVKRDGNPIEVRCGTTWNSEMHLCPECDEKALERYPQGWRYYPGDTCKPGTYVGGCGVDHMCGLCESGDD